MDRMWAAAAVGAGVVVSCAGAFEASIRVVAQRASRVYVAPGEVFYVEALLTYPHLVGGWHQFAGVQGSIVIDGDAGSPSNFRCFFSSSVLIRWGEFVGGSRVGLDYELTPAFFQGGFIPPQIPNVNGLLGGYDLKIDEPGEYGIRWEPGPTYTSVRLFPSVPSPYWVDAKTEYFGTTVIVTPCRPDLTTTAIPGQAGYGEPDGVLNNDDFAYYLAQFAAGNVLVGDQTHAAIPDQPGYGMPDGVLTNDDFFFYLAIFAAGC
ncbi:MAG: hypothetical protein KDA05_07075 [Phycisphaerales bacterium]|nr:hypothetical protein [Phycisphaerales bacterium]